MSPIPFALFVCQYDLTFGYLRFHQRKYLSLVRVPARQARMTSITFSFTNTANHALNVYIVPTALSVFTSKSHHLLTKDS